VSSRDRSIVMRADYTVREKSGIDPNASAFHESGILGCSRRNEAGKTRSCKVWLKEVGREQYIRAENVLIQERDRVEYMSTRRIDSTQLTSNQD